LEVVRVRVLWAALACALLPASAGAATPSGLRLGVLGDADRFDHQTAQHSRVRLLIVGWSQSSSPEYFKRLLGSMRDEPMLGPSTGSEGAPETITPRQIAQGAGDSFLFAVNEALAQWGTTVYVRPLAEMNGHWNAYSAYNKDGSARGADHSTAEYRKAFARIYVLLHGGKAVNAKLRSLGLPTVRGPLRSNPNAQVIWNPQGYGSPDVPGNTAQSYYPGDRYVDVVGDDLYDIGGKAEWAAAEALYKAHPGKPFAFPEWGLWDVDDPAFVTQMGAFLRAHPRTIIANYYSGRAGSIFDLASKPRSRAEYRKVIAPLGG
jgi:hypothetical protein